MTDHVRITKADGVLALVISRPEKKNALTQAMYAAIADAIEGAEQDPEATVILIRGEGDIFTAGNDLGDFAAGRKAGEPLHSARFLRALANASRPIVAAVHGRAVGIGTTMLLHCDCVIVAEGTLLTTPFVNLALVPEAASSLLMQARIGYVRAFNMFALGEPVSAQDAVSWGLANKMTPLAELVSTAEGVAARLARQPPGALRATKRLMRNVTAITDQMAAEREEFEARLSSPEAKEAFAAFAERRPADFSRFR